MRVVNVVDLMRLQPETEHPHGLSDARVRRAVHHRPAGDLRLPRLPVADPPADLPAARPRTTSTCAATRRRAPRPRRSTWSCSTTSTGSTSSWTSSTGCRGSAARGRAPPPADGRRAAATPRLHPRARRGRAGDQRLDLAGRWHAATAGLAGTDAVRVLVVNAGSSSLKLRCSTTTDESWPSADLAAPAARSTPRALSAALDRRSGRPDAVGHRVVHGGTRVHRAGPDRRRRPCGSCAR